MPACFAGDLWGYPQRLLPAAAGKSRTIGNFSLVRKNALSTTSRTYPRSRHVYTPTPANNCSDPDTYGYPTSYGVVWNTLGV